MSERFKHRYRNPRLSVVRLAISTVLIALFAAAGTLHGQAAPGAGTVTPLNPSGQVDPNSPAALAAAYGVASPNSTPAQTAQATPTFSDNTTSLSTSQIMSVLQTRPEAVLELKSLLADQLQLRGAQVSADDITDDQLYSQISTNADLRAHVTTFLRARGYVSANVAPDRASPAEERNQGSLLEGQDDQDPSDPRDSSAAYALGLPGQSTLDLLQGNTPRTAGRLGATSARDRTPPQRVDRDPKTNTLAEESQVLRSPAPYNLQSMRDLYTQIPDPNVALKRFGSEVFLSRNMATPIRSVSGRDTPLDVPLGPDYIIGAGDALTISLWGGITQTISRVIDHDGRILLPEGGSLLLAGLPLARAQSLIDTALKPQYRNAQISVTVSQLRSIRIYVVGDVQRPGGFDVTALATPVSALYAAGGPTATGSLRTLRHLRGNTLVEEIDLYDFLLHGLRKESVRFESGDTLLVPPVGPQIAISGAVKRPAIYELKAAESGSHDATLSTILEDAGGATASAALSHITIERITASHQRETITLQPWQTSNDGLATFQVVDGDRIHISPILPYSERAIYLEGHVVRPGRQPYTEGMHLSDVLHSYRDMLPEPAARGEIVRLVAPDLHAETITFDVSNVLIGNGNIELLPFDTIRVHGRYEVDAPKVTVHGEVLRPGTFPLSDGMTAAQLVRMAGGFKRDALLESADLTSYTVTNGTSILGDITSVHIGAAVSGSDAVSDVPLKPGDILTIHQITNWEDIGQAVKIDGQVAFPGSYGFKEGERLSSIVRRAGGLLSTAYPAGAVLVRQQVRDLEEKSRQELIRQIETSSAAAHLSPTLQDAGQDLQLIQAQQDQVLARLRSEPPSGRLVVQISADIDAWANTDADIELRRGDVLTIPKRPGFVLVTGQVYNATALTFTPGKTAEWYLQHAGGTNSTANRKEIFVIRANGSIIGRRSSGWFDGKVLSTRLDAGDVVVVPQKVIGGSLFWRNLLTTAQLASSIAITAAVAGL